MYPLVSIQAAASGIPKGQPRPRAFAFRGHARMYDPGTAEGWKSQVAGAVQNQRPSRPLIGPISVELEFRMPRPKSHFLKGGTLKESAPHLHTGKPDADNLAKAVMDALTELNVWQDDSQVSELHVSKVYSTCPGCFIRIGTTLTQ